MDGVLGGLTPLGDESPPRIRKLLRARSVLELSKVTGSRNRLAPRAFSAERKG